MQDGRALPGNIAHFGYRDGFAQPTIAGGLPPIVPDVLPPAPAGEFLFGYPSQYTDFTYPVPSPADRLGVNGSFVAYRILAQDCAGFEAFLARSARDTGLDAELIAAKLCGRWRNGIPLALSPESPDLDLPPERYNSFDYTPTETVPDAFDDRRGHRCPIGAHVRRMNPRHSTVAGNSGLKRRLVRRGLPYGPPFDPATPDDGIERGLLGLFVGVSLKDQFEFLMSDWANKGSFAPGLRGTRDAIIGDNSPAGRRVPDPTRRPTDDATRRTLPLRHDARRRLRVLAEPHRPCDTWAKSRPAAPSSPFVYDGPTRVECPLKRHVPILNASSRDRAGGP